MLVVDDSISAREALGYQLFAATRVITASSGEEALQLLKQNPDVRLIMLDLVMDTMDGLAILKHLLAQKGHHRSSRDRVSGLASDDQLAQFLKLGGNDFIRKAL